LSESGGPLGRFPSSREKRPATGSGGKVSTRGQRSNPTSQAEPARVGSGGGRDQSPTGALRARRRTRVGGMRILEGDIRFGGLSGHLPTSMRGGRLSSTVREKEVHHLSSTPQFHVLGRGGLISGTRRSTPTCRHQCFWAQVRSFKVRPTKRLHCSSDPPLEHLSGEHVPEATSRPDNRSPPKKGRRVGRVARGSRGGSRRRTLPRGVTPAGRHHCTPDPVSARRWRPEG